MKIKKVNIHHVYFVDLEDDEYGGEYYRDCFHDWWLKGEQLHWKDPVVKKLEELLRKELEFIG